MLFWKILLIISTAHAIAVPRLKCPQEEIDGTIWPEKNVGESAIKYCGGLGYYRRICLYKNTPSGPQAVWSRLVNMCSMYLLFEFIIECKGDNTWKDTVAGEYAYIECPGEYEGYIGRYCDENGNWGKTKDLCYLPDGKKAEEYEVEL